MFKQFLEKFPLHYYFGVGGIGDLFLVISSFYHNYYGTSDKIGLVFWANNEKIIKQILSYFPNIKPIITQNYLSTLNAMNYYEDIVNTNKFIGKAHIPNKFQYVKEWININNVFDEYKIQRNNEFYRQIFKSESRNNKVVIQPKSQQDEYSYKKRYITKNNIDNILKNNEKKDIVIIGSEQDVKDYTNLNVTICTDINDSLVYVTNAREVHACDSWSKTLSGLIGIPTYYYTSERTDDYDKIFSGLYDPSDNVFLKNWNFNIVNQFNYDISHLGTNNKYL